MDKDISDWRKKIDGVDDELLRLFNERAACAVKIGKIKRTENMEVYDPEREHGIIERMTGRNKGPLDERAVVDLFRRVIDESRRIERLAVHNEQSEKEPH